MLRSTLRAAATSTRIHSWELRTAAIPAVIYSSENPYSTLARANRDKFKLDVSKSPNVASASRATGSGDAVFDVQERQRLLAADEKNSLDVGPDGRPLFTTTPSLSQLTRKDSCTYFKFTYTL